MRSKWMPTVVLPAETQKASSSGHAQPKYLQPNSLTSLACEKLQLDTLIDGEVVAIDQSG